MIQEILLYATERVSSYPFTIISLLLGGLYLLFVELNDVRMKKIAKEAKDRNFKVVVVGGGVGGLGMGVKLSKMGIEYVILEKGADLGGTWYDNTYPGCGCDVQSHLYSFSEFLNPYWSQSYSGAAEILKYVNDFADHFDLRRHIMFKSKVTSSTWNAKTSQWTVQVEGKADIIADVVILGVGLLHVPHSPKFEGAEHFTGKVLHTAQWDNDYNPEGRRIAVIGTGATSVQLVPALGAQDCAQLTVFQRSATWATPRGNYRYWRVMKVLFKYVPFIARLYRWFLFIRLESRFFLLFMLTVTDENSRFNILAWARDKFQDFVHYKMRQYVQHVVKNPTTADQLIPPYKMGCKRITPSDDYLQTFNNPRVELVTDPISRITSDGIVTKSGAKHTFDTIIYATGFDLIASVNAFDVVTKDGTMLAAIHNDSPKAYLGITHDQCPNFYMIGGPGIVIGHNSVLFIGECQINYIAQALERMIVRKVSSVVLKKEAHEEYTRWVMRTMKGKVFEADKHCTSWYRNKDGFNWTFWPTNLICFWWSTMKFDEENYHLTGQSH